MMIGSRSGQVMALIGGTAEQHQRWQVMLAAEAIKVVVNGTSSGIVGDVGGLGTVVTLEGQGAV